MTQALESWLARQYVHAGAQMLRSISRTDLEKSRPGFGQHVRAAAGSVIASPVLADWDPEPDYFFHWFRDSSLVIDALRVLHADGQVGREAVTMLADFVAFSSALRALDGRRLQQDDQWRAGVSAGFRKYLRDDAQLGAVRGEEVVAETRVNADGTLDISTWTRPQHDGAALRVLALLRWRRQLRGDASLDDAIAALVEHDLAFVLSHWHEPAFDMWEEERGAHYHTLCVSAAALEQGAAWREEVGDAGASRDLRLAAHRIRTRLDDFWLPAAGHYSSRILEGGAPSAKTLDISVVLAAIHAWNGSGGAHTPADPRMHATLRRLMEMFAQDYPINHGGRRGPAMGRYRGDHYFSGGAYYFSTLGASELCFRAATAQEGEAAARWVALGDDFLDTVRVFTPDSGDLSEQFDQRTGAQASARHLAWSYAAFLTCADARRAAYQVVQP